jgi:hypothetical protein
MQKPDNDLKPYVGIWNSAESQTVIIAISKLEVRENGKFDLNIITVGEKRTEDKLYGSCKVVGERLVLVVEKCDGKIEERMPFELHATLDKDILILTDKNGEGTIRYENTKN